MILGELMMAPIEDALDAAYTVHRAVEAPERAAFLADLAPKVRAVVSGGATGMDPSWFDALPALGVIAINGVGTDKVDLERARRQGVRVATALGVLTDDVADMALGLVLEVTLQHAGGDRTARNRVM